MRNGYIEGNELENFFQELEAARRGAGVEGSSVNIGEKLKEFMQKYDKNADGRIEMAELAQILPTEENFLLCFRQHAGSSIEFMEAWRKYDTDRSGYIEANELKETLKELLEARANKDRHFYLYDDRGNVKALHSRIPTKAGTFIRHRNGPFNGDHNPKAKRLCISSFFAPELHPNRVLGAVDEPAIPTDPLPAEELASGPLSLCPPFSPNDPLIHSVTRQDSRGTPTHRRNSSTVEGTQRIHYSSYVYKRHRERSSLHKH
ncbi:calretinin [Pelobates cultripes]|uniref:Calretinin n=1 Tax=Pelobates cultripes TaxID=61616 RepID=A0AAD1TF60_PELCU|nr:calretinin [Pelobates cultripes]